MNLTEYPNYEIHRNGNVINKKTKKVLKPFIRSKSSSPYYCLSLSNVNKIYKKVYIHTLMALAFIPNPNNYNQIDHIDGNKLNNNICNLRWCTSSENNTNKEKLSRQKDGPEKRFKYVSWNKQNKKWIGKIQINGKSLYIGSSKNDEEIYIKCLQCLVNINKENEFLSPKIQEDIIKLQSSS
jgi:hypothetical protein